MTSNQTTAEVQGYLDQLARLSADAPARARNSSADRPVGQPALSSLQQVAAAQLSPACAPPGQSSDRGDA